MTVSCCLIHQTRRPAGHLERIIDSLSIALRLIIPKSQLGTNSALSTSVVVFYHKDYLSYFDMPTCMYCLSTEQFEVIVYG